jgi:hypothetical protein
MTLNHLFHRRCYASLWQFCMKLFFAAPEAACYPRRLSLTAIVAGLVVSPE